MTTLADAVANATAYGTVSLAVVSIATAAVYSFRHLTKWSERNRQKDHIILGVEPTFADPVGKPSIDTRVEKLEHAISEVKDRTRVLDPSEPDSLSVRLQNIEDALETVAKRDE